MRRLFANTKAPAAAVSIVIVVFLLSLAASCGGKYSSPTQPTGGQAVVTLNSGGASSHSITVPPSTAVMFQNLDNVSHQISSGSGCSELNGPMLAAGASFTAMMSAQAETCEFHDGLNPTKTAFQGTITVSPTAMGPTY